jgi:hypothetical protein
LLVVSSCVCFGVNRKSYFVVFFFGVGALLIVGYVMLGWKRRGMGKIAWVYICLFGDSMGGKT